MQRNIICTYDSTLQHHHPHRRHHGPSYGRDSEHDGHHHDLLDKFMAAATRRYSSEYLLLSEHQYSVLSIVSLTDS